MAYPNKTINDGPYGSFMAKPGEAALGIYVRCKFTDPTTSTPDGSPVLELASATERADVVTLQPIAAGAYGSVKYLNSGGETYGRMVGTVASGTQLYAAASGKVTAASGGGALKVGKTTTTGRDGGAVCYAPHAQTT